MMSSGAGSSSGMRWPDAAVAAGCVVLIGVLVWVAIGPRSPRQARPETLNMVVQQNMRSIHQVLLLYGLSNNNYLPGLNADGTLLTNDPAERFDLLVEGHYLTADFLVSPTDARPDAAYSYALLDIATPGARRAAWTTESQPDAPILAESLAATGHADDPAAWSGWVVWHSDYLSAETAAISTERADSPRLSTRYAATGPFNDADDLFAADGPDDAYLIAPDR